MIKNKINENLRNTLLKLGVKDEEPDLEHPSLSRFGDYSTSVALRLAKRIKKSPLEIAKSIADNFPQNKLVKKIDVVKPGFVNLWLSDEVLVKEMEKLAHNNTHKTNLYAGKKIMIEYTDPNPFKEFHIGHLYSNIVGESLARILEAVGAQVKRANYQGDMGMHVAKSIWGMRKKMEGEKIGLPELEKKPLKDRVRFLGASYALGASLYEEDPKVKEEIIGLNKMIYEKNSAIQSLYQAGRQWSLDYFETIYNRLGVNNNKGRFDYYYFESEVGEIGKKLVLEYLEKGVFEKSRGAVIFPGKKIGLHDRVFINSLGLPTYEAKELGLAPTKYKDFPYDQSIIVTGNEIVEYFKVLIAALTKIAPELGQKTKHVAHGMVRLPEGKISSRTGKVITGEWLLDEAKKKADKKIQETKKEAAEIVGIGAVKYALLRNGIGRDVEFNFDESVSFEGNSGPYLQYTYVRTRSILAKNEETKMIIPAKMEKEEIDLLRSFYQFPEIIEKAALNFSPNFIAVYLFDLAQKYNLFYQKHPVLKAGPDQRNVRLMLTKATGQIIKKGLYLLGVETVERM
jgi:arginyl-tRNA synthetase